MTFQTSNKCSNSIIYLIKSGNPSVQGTAHSKPLKRQQSMRACQKSQYLNPATLVFHKWRFAFQCFNFGSKWVYFFLGRPRELLLPSSNEQKEDQMENWNVVTGMNTVQTMVKHCQRVIPSLTVYYWWNLNFRYHLEKSSRVQGQYLSIQNHVTKSSLKSSKVCYIT